MTAPVQVGPSPADSGPTPHPGTAGRIRPIDPRTPITTRQLEVLRLAANGHSNDSIGRRLNISPTTVNHSLRSTYLKLGARDRTHAVAIAIVRGLIREQDIVGVQLVPGRSSVHRNTA